MSGNGLISNVIRRAADRTGAQAPAAQARVSRGGWRRPGARTRAGTAARVRGGGGYC